MYPIAIITMTGSNAILEYILGHKTMLRGLKISTPYLLQWILIAMQIASAKACNSPLKLYLSGTYKGLITCCNLQDKTLILLTAGH